MEKTLLISFSPSSLVFVLLRIKSKTAIIALETDSL